MEILFIVLILLVFVGLPLFQIRKQNQRMRQLRDFQESVREGMLVKTTSGLHGRVVRVGESTVDLEVAKNTVATWDKAAIYETVDSVDAGSAHAPAQEPGAEQNRNPFN
ncbi:MAG TPA: preprotein translocase subunit YajC [Candidatus Corynebacterium gallistercoris]|uniref:Preprotein translocase subunit YajC n=1 Tax=Candidatus Corynebacterium gallistercoris TaxID=2838530 RepID=A0A9D1UQY6_9CORY|nr:preprotein translocase subunit YajC [Candidatus Corynebacterium gallistercoris]